MIDDLGYGRFVQAELPGLLRFAHLITGNPHTAEEAVQAALVNTLRAWPRLMADPAFQPGPYVRRAVVNNHLNAMRRWGNRITLGPVPDRHLPDESTSWIERDEMVRALRSLPSRQRTVLVLRYYEELSEAEIAAFLGCRPGTVKSAAARGLAALRTQLQRAAEPMVNAAVPAPSPTVVGGTS